MGVAGAFTRPYRVAVFLSLLHGLAIRAYLGSSNPWPCVLGAFLVLGTLFVRDGPFRRPRLVFWRLCFSIGVLYLLALVYLLHQPLPVARELMALVDSRLNHPLPERTYADQCKVTPANVWNQLDVFVVAHIIGWWFKALMVRDGGMLWLLGVLFEVLEYSLAHQLPNFGECWWDHWILDVLTCNWLGIFLGMQTARWLGLKMYNFNALRAGGHSSVGLVAPQTFRSYCLVVLLSVFFLGSELNCFYLKHLLWIPASHRIVGWRLLLHAILGSAAIREAFDHFSGAKDSVGMYTWLMAATIAIEAILGFKWGVGHFVQPAPQGVVQLWQAFAACLVAFPLWQYWLHPQVRHVLSPGRVKVE